MQEPAFRIEDVTFCIWRQVNDANWRVGTVDFPADHSDPDGSEFLLSALDGRPETYQIWAKSYYECDLQLAAVEHVFRHRSLTPEVIAQLNRELSLADLLAALNEIGYPA